MNAKILIVDDEAAICSMLSAHFRSLGYDVATANSGAEALKIMEEKRFEVVVSDIMMPVMKGTELIREIRAQYPMTRVVMMTGYVTLENALTCMRRGAESCVFKPFTNYEELDRAVARAIEHLVEWQRKLLELQHMRLADPGEP